MMYYGEAPGATQTTNATPNTANDCYFIKPGASRCVWLAAVYVIGKGAGLTQITGIVFRGITWTTTASSGGTALTPDPDDEGYQAAVHTSGWAAGAVTSGTGGPNNRFTFGCGVASPGQWIPPSGLIDEMPMLQGGENRSIDIQNITGGVSLNFEMSLKTRE